VSSPAASIVCLPATLSGGVQWTALRRSWVGDHEWVTPELLAEGRSMPLAPHEELYADLMAREVAQLLQSVRGRSPVHLVGHSYGGVVARRFAREYPEHVRTLTLIEPVCFELLRHFGPATLVDEMRALKESCRTDLRHRPLAAAERFVTYWWGGSSAWMTLSAGAQRRAALGMIKAVVGWEEIWDSPPSPGGEFRGPTLLMSGTRSPAPSRWITRHCATDIFPRSHYEEIAWAGHFSPMTHLVPVATALARLIGEAEGAAFVLEPAAQAEAD